MCEYIKFLNFDYDYSNNVHGDKKNDNLDNNATIEVKNLSFKYPRSEEYVLSNVNLKINSGERLAIVGMNGAGKTTFIKLLCRLYDVTEGEILINGINIADYKYSEYVKLLSVVFQDFKLFSFTLKENIRLGDINNECKDVLPICKLSGIDSLINKYEKGLKSTLYKDFDEMGVEPSGGEAQKIAIARAMYKESPIVIMDEPTAALDPVAEEETYRNFNKLLKNRTAIYISHRLSSCIFCDKIVVFSDKTIKEYGTHDELMNIKNGIYAKMFSAQSENYN